MILDLDIVDWRLIEELVLCFLCGIGDLGKTRDCCIFCFLIINYKYQI